MFLLRLPVEKRTLRGFIGADVSVKNDAPHRLCNSTTKKTSTAQQRPRVSEAAEASGNDRTGYSDSVVDVGQRWLEGEEPSGSGQKLGTRITCPCARLLLSTCGTCRPLFSVQ